MSDLKDNFAPLATPVVPTVEEETRQGSMRYDIFSRLLKERTIVLDSPIMDQSATLVCAQLLFLQSVDPDKDIDIIINSPGGSITAGMAIFDTMRNLSCDVRTIGRGMCASMGSFLLSAGTPGKRLVLPNTTVMIHQPRTQGGGQGVETSTDKQQNSKLIAQTRRKMEGYYAAFMGLPYDENFERLIDDAMEKDTFMNATLAKQMGLIDEVVMPADWENSPYKKLEFENLMITEAKDLEDAAADRKDPLNAAIALRDARDEYLAQNAPALNAPTNDEGTGPAAAAPTPGL